MKPDLLILYIGKIVTAVATPLSLGIIALALAAVSLLRRTPRSHILKVILFAMVLLLFCSSGRGVATSALEP